MKLPRFEPMGLYGAEVAHIDHWRIEIDRDDDGEYLEWHIKIYDLRPESASETMCAGPCTQRAFARRVAVSLWRLMADVDTATKSS